VSVEITIDDRGAYFEVRATAEIVDQIFLNQLIDTVAQTLLPLPQPFFRVLIQAVAPQAHLDIIEAFEAWKRASEKGIQRMQIAYVVSGRPISPLAKYMETFAENRGIRLRFFADRKAALDWLCPEAHGG
jgi:hypothetical protein